MDPLNWKRLPLLAVAGIAIGFGAAWLVERTDWHPLVAPALATLAAGGLAVALRRLELLNFLIEDGVFSYCTFVGVALVRTSGHNYVADKFAFVPGSGLLSSFNVVVAAVGIPFALGVVFIVALPVWAFAQRTRHQETADEERFWSFVKEQNRSR